MHCNFTNIEKTGGRRHELGYLFRYFDWQLLERLGFEIFFLFAASITVLQLAQPPSHLISRAVSPAVKRMGYEADDTTYSTEVNNGGVISPLPPRAFVSWCFINPT
jgi:hypothetical protein